MINLPQDQARSSVERLIELNTDDGVWVELVSHGMEPNPKCLGYRVSAKTVNEVMTLIAQKLKYCPNCGELNDFPSTIAIRGFILVQGVTD